MANLSVAPASIQLTPLLANLANRLSLAAALSIGLLIVVAMVIGDVLDQERRRDNQE
jgi:hypothetical protein